MKVKFLGGAEIVGKLGMLVENKGANVMFEYGLRLVKKEPPQFPMESPNVEGVFITHSHLDHSGAVPRLVQETDCDVYCNDLTMDIVSLLFFDSIKIAKAEGYGSILRYNDVDVKHVWQNYRSFQVGDTRSIAGLEIVAHNAGHIPGAQMYEIKGHETTLFTGDLHTENTRLTYGAKPVQCDNLVIEATYAGRNHPPRPKSEALLQQKVREVVERGGTAIIPCFAVGRMQEVMLILKDLPYDMWVDGMGKTVNGYYTDHPDYLRSIKEFKAAKRKFNPVRTSSARDKARRGQVIITTSGMLDGGPVLHYLADQKDNAKSAVMMVGYQAENSNGRMLKERGMVETQDGLMKINCEVMTFDLSAHADHDELLNFIKGCKPNKVVLMHSDNREELAQDLEGDFEVLMPMSGDYFEL
ncbi:MAG: Beta-Casp domain protein [Methanomassiliicoccales archaeon PtaB.Bin134]|jgi:putative mRNA 3-end processing factor|nr:MAG: Beta-Casp domain protein [Methanomassiliicoccales archaeon PtaB.Bin134]